MISFLYRIITNFNFQKDIDYKSKVLFSTKTGQYEITFEVY
jgi:hypothetical protein